MVHDLDTALTKIFDLERKLKQLMRTTAEHLYGIAPGTMVRHTDGRIGQVTEVEAENAVVRWANEVVGEHVCYGNLEVVFENETVAS